MAYSPLDPRNVFAKRANPAPRAAPGNGTVPEILYVVQYQDKNSKYIGMVRSDKPINVECSSPGIPKPVDKEAEVAKPVIEIRPLAECYASNGIDSTQPQYSSFYDHDFDILDDDDVVTISNRIYVEHIEKTEMVIHSQYLKHALDAVQDHARRNEYVGPDRFTVSAPYRELVRQRSALAYYRTHQPDSHSADRRETTAKHIDVLLDFLEQTLGAAIRDEESRYQWSPPAATFDLAWMLYKPGEVVYAKPRDSTKLGDYSNILVGNERTGDRWTPYVISDVDVICRNAIGEDKIRILCWNVICTTGEMRRVCACFIVSSFPGTQPIHCLTAIPAAYFPEDPDKQGGLSMADWQIQLGREYWELAKRPVYKECLLEGGCDARVERMVVDFSGYYRYHAKPMTAGKYTYRESHCGRGIREKKDCLPMVLDNTLPEFVPHCACDECNRQPDADRKRSRWADFNQWTGRDSCRPRDWKTASPADDLFYLVCSTAIPGFMLSRRAWEHVDQSQLRAVQADETAFDELVLDADIKRTVRALVGKFAASRGDDGVISPWKHWHDLVRNKGEGRIFLLHGPPGVGKTCTAECVAELAHRPLLAVTAGDLIGDEWGNSSSGSNSNSSSSSSIQRNLELFLGLGERYGAVVLLDEVDVFLAARGAGDVRHDGMVSVFLRALEYFRGVLVLTTNRVAVFDAAFTSRIHVALRYRALTAEDRSQVWTLQFQRLTRSSRAVVESGARRFACDSPEMQALGLNGREIRNMLQTAVALAEEDAQAGRGSDDGESDDGTVTVREEHLRAVAKLSQGFKEFMHDSEAHS